MLDSCSLAASYKVTYLGCVTSTTGALTTTLQTNNLIGRGNGGGGTSVTSNEIFMSSFGRVENERVWREVRVIEGSSYRG